MVATLLAALSMGLALNQTVKQDSVAAVKQDSVVPTPASAFFNEEFIALMRGDASSSSCSAVGDCGKSYQACCIAFGLKGYDSWSRSHSVHATPQPGLALTCLSRGAHSYPCGCHLQDGSGTAGSNCGDCGTEFATCCIGFKAKGYPCTCDVA